MPPEFIERGIIARSGDLYSLGIIIIEILTGQKGHEATEDVLESWSSRIERTQQETQCVQIRVCYKIALECTGPNPMKRPASALNIIDMLQQTEGIQKKNSHKGDGDGEQKKNPNTGNGDDKHKTNSNKGLRGSEQKKNADNGGVGSRPKKNSANGEGDDEQKNNPDKASGGGKQKNNPDNSGGGHGQKKNPNNGHGANKVDKAGSQSQPNEDKEKKPQPEETKPTMYRAMRSVHNVLSSVLGSAPRKETTVLLRIHLHCDVCAKRVTQRIRKIKGVKHVVVEDIAKDKVKVVGTMDVAAMVVYLKDKLERNVEAVGPGKKGDKKDEGGSGDGKKMQKDKEAAAGDVHKDTGKAVEAALASNAPSKKDDKKDKEGSGDHEKKQKDEVAATGDEHNDKWKGIKVDGPRRETPEMVAPRYGSVAYSPSSYYMPYGGNANSVGYANAGCYYQHPNPQPNQPYPPYNFVANFVPAPLVFSDENPNACSIM